MLSILLLYVHQCLWFFHANRRGVLKSTKICNKKNIVIMDLFSFTRVSSNYTFIYALMLTINFDTTEQNKISRSLSVQDPEKNRLV